MKRLRKMPRLTNAPAAPTTTRAAGNKPRTTPKKTHGIKNSERSTPKKTRDPSANLGKYLHMPKGGKIGTKAVTAVARAIRGAKKGTLNAY